MVVRYALEDYTRAYATLVVIIKAHAELVQPVDEVSTALFHESGMMLFDRRDEMLDMTTPWVRDQSS